MFKLQGVIRVNLERLLFAVENDEFIFNSFGYLFIDIQKTESFIQFYTGAKLFIH